MAGLFGDIISSLSLSSWYSLRRNCDDSAFEAYDTRAARPLFAFHQSRTTTAVMAQTIHLYNVDRNLWLTNGDTLEAEYSGITAANANEKVVRIKFAGTTILNSEDLDVDFGNNKSWHIDITITRENATTVRCAARMRVYGFDPLADYTQITSLDLEGTSYDLICELETGTAAGDATLRMAHAKMVNAPAAAIVTTSLWDYWEADSYSQSDGSNITTNWTGKYASKTATVSGTPTYEDSELNGSLPVLRFVSASSEYFTLPTMAALTAGHIFMVLKVTDVSVNGGHKLGSYASNDTYYPYAPDTPDGIYEAFGSTDRKTVGGSVSTITDWHVLEMFSATNNWSLYQNGQLLHNDTSHTVGFGSAPRIFHNGATGMTGDLWGFYIFTAKLSDANREKMYRYIAQTTGV